jgi:hypothetical protein
MPAIPQITLTATLEDLSGVAAGSIANPARLRIALCGYGASLPRIAGTSNLAKVGPFDSYSDGTALSIQLWGNDAITPAGTFYSIMVLDGEENVVQCANYQFAGTTTVDLSSAAPYLPPLFPVIPIAALEVQYALATPAAPQVANTIYTAPGAVIAVYYSGMAQRPGIDWIATTASQFQLTFATNANDTVYALCALVASPNVDLQFSLCAPAGPQAAGTLYTAPGKVVMVYYDPLSLRPVIDYTLVTAETFTLNFALNAGDVIYALYSI